MVLVSHKYKFIYIKNLKVAGSSVESFFGRYCIDPNKNYSYDDDINEHIDDYGIIGQREDGKKSISQEEMAIGWQTHKEAQDIKRDLGEDKFNEYFKFCVIRNPYDKMVSWYHWYIFTNKIPPNYPFNHFCRFCKINNFYIHGIDGESVCDYFIRFENLEEDIIKLCNKLGIKDYDIDVLPKHKSGVRPKDSGYREYYDEITRKLVYKNHKEEFELFGYEF